MSNLTEDQLKQQNTALLVQWANTHFRNRLCPICGATNWFHILDIFELRKYTGGGLVVGGNIPVITVVPTICQTCGYVFLISPNKIGIQQLKGNPEAFRNIANYQYQVDGSQKDELPKNIADKYK